MFRNRIYYSLKPLLPWSVRMGVRRWFAQRKRKRVEEAWPVQPGSEKPPEGWPGWPDGKQFAFVLTHDVEGPVGLQRVKQLAELEMSLGFRSCFNFIPEGTYCVTAELRDWLTNRGFEVGVHDLKHDGRLYRSRHEFNENARQINRYLKDWGAVGFRSGFMLNNLDWLHELDIAYDASTFDTDPFEPQPDGRNTIFPFWVSQKQKAENRNQKLPKSDGSEFEPATFNSPFSEQRNSSESQLSDFSSQRLGYVELPYTLPQDSTLFLLLRETSPAVWIKKLNWVARQGGMALLDVHPDYLDFSEKSTSRREYGAAIYRQFLQHVRETYGNTFWQGLPREVAKFAASFRPVCASRRPKRICMVTHSFYLSDGRVTRYAEALAQRGDHVDVLSLRASPEMPAEEKVAGVNLFRIQDRHGKNEKSQLSYLIPLLRFLVTASIRITRRHRRQRYDVLHIHNVPDFLVFAALVPRVTGAKVILDIHDIVPEFYASKFGQRKHNIAEAALKWIERRSARFASHVIISNHLWFDKFVARTGTNGKCSVFVNHVDNQLFHARPRMRRDDRSILLFPGGLQWHQGLDIALRAFTKVSAAFPRAEFHIYGDGNMKPALVSLAKELGFNGHVKFFPPVSTREIAEVMANADLGVVPKRADSFGNEAYSTKIMEFMALGVPVVVSSTKIDRFYFNDSVVKFFESGNEAALADAIVGLLQDREARSRMIMAGREYVAGNSWETRKQDYLKLVDDLCLRALRTNS
jgi:glycosyltransferase involved in cell wall biosynthesis